MELVELGISVTQITVGALGSGVGWAMDRHRLKKGDVLLHEEAERERETDRLRETFPDITEHCLHPQHPLKFEEEGELFSCSACTQEGKGNRYSCKSCDFKLHHPCAVSNEILTSLISETMEVKDIIDQHPLNLFIENSEYTCSLCSNKSKRKHRYYCQPCKSYFDLICANHSARLLSFLHPQHELELKARHRFRDCKMCSHGGETNNRVYTCDECEFFVHPDCAVRSQYAQHSLHPDHILVFMAVPDKTKVKCMACKKKCKQWCYSCNVCEGVSFHTGCIGSAITGSNSSSVTRFVDDCSEEESSTSGIIDTITGVFSGE